MDGLRRKIQPSAPPPPLEERTVFPQKRYLPEETLNVRHDDPLPEKYQKKIQSKKLLRRLFFSALAIIFIALFSFCAFFLWKTYAVSKKISVGNPAPTSFVQDVKAIVSPNSVLRGQETGRINILLMGAAGKNNPGGNLTDTVMVMSVDTENNKVAMLSLPRDLWVNIPETKSFAKINSLYKIGLNENLGADLIKQSVENITGLPIDYYVAVDFEGFKKIINDFGGINVMVARDIFDQRYPGPNYSYETFSLSKGFHTLDGATTLKYVRERHDDPQGDFGRALRQQQVIQAVKSKLFSAQTLFNVVALSSILDTLGDNIKTDMQFSDIESFVALSKKLDTQNITNVVADAWKPDSLLKVSHVQVGNVSAFVLLPRVGNYSEIQDLALNIFNQSELKKRHQAISDENARIAIINHSGDNRLVGKIQTLLSDKLGMKNVHVIFENKNEIAQQTTVSDNSNGSKIYTLDELIKKIPARIATQSVAGGPAVLASNSDTAGSTDDITLTLGQDVAQIYGVEDATLEQYNQAQDQENN